MEKVLGLGDNVCDIYLHTQTMYPGGQAVNFAVYAHQLGAISDFMGVFGQDAVAEHVQAVLDAQNVGRSHCRSYPGENGFALVTLSQGDRVFKGSNRGGVLQKHPIYLSQGDLSYAAGFDLIHTTNNGFIDGLLPTLHQLSPLISYDFSYRWNEHDRVERVCPYIDLAFLSCSDLDEMQVQELCRHLHGKGCGVVTATRGSKSAIVFDGIRFYEQSPRLVEPVDTMGAGDSFATAMLIGLLRAMKGKKEVWHQEDFRRSTFPKVLQSAADFASQTCLVYGAFGCGVPIPDELRTRLNEPM